jgi:PqqD family protein of HPr-rel-A system
MAEAPDVVGPTFVPCLAADVSSVVLDGEAVLYDESSHRVHLLNPTATVIWACCDGNGNVDDIATDIAAVLELDRGAVAGDVLETVRDFARLGLLAGVTG